jgi:hypothetical protein
MVPRLVVLLRQLRPYLLEQITERRLAPIPKESLTDQALIDKLGRMYCDMMGNTIARQLNRTINTGAGINPLAPEGGGQEGGDNISSVNLTRKEE